MLLCGALTFGTAGCGVGDSDENDLPDITGYALREVLIGVVPTGDDLTCADTPEVAAGEITDCVGTSQFGDMPIRVAWDDDQGHFTATYTVDLHSATYPAETYSQLGRAPLTR